MLDLADSFRRSFCTFFGSMRRLAAKTMIVGAPLALRSRANSRSMPTRFSS